MIAVVGILLLCIPERKEILAVQYVVAASSRCTGCILCERKFISDENTSKRSRRDVKIATRSNLEIQKRQIVSFPAGNEVAREERTETSGIVETCLVFLYMSFLEEDMENEISHSEKCEPMLSTYTLPAAWSGPSKCNQ